MSLTAVLTTYEESMSAWKNWWTQNIAPSFGQAKNLGSYAMGDLETLAEAIEGHVDLVLSHSTEHTGNSYHRIIVLIEECSKPARGDYALELLEHLPKKDGRWGNLYGDNHPHDGLLWFPPDSEGRQEISIRFIEWGWGSSPWSLAGGIPYSCIAMYALGGNRKEIWDTALVQ